MRMVCCAWLIEGKIRTVVSELPKLGPLRLSQLRVERLLMGDVLQVLHHLSSVSAPGRQEHDLRTSGQGRGDAGADGQSAHWQG